MSPATDGTTVLAGDIGGTNARLALVELRGGGATIVHEETYPSAAHAGLEPIVEQFLSGVSPRPDRAGFGIAGPVVNGECKASNLPWTINAQRLGQAIGISQIVLINDFTSVGYGVGLLGAADLATLQAGVPVAHAPRALIGAGTGLGEGFVFWDGRGDQVVASEGGHADFAPRNDLQFGAARFLAQRYGRVSWERVLSGRGIADTYEYLATLRPADASPDIRAEMANTDPAAVITGHALAGTDPLCSAAVGMFVEVLGAQAGNLALTVVATGGVFVAGGIAPRLVPLLQAGPFTDAFRAKGRLSTLLAAVPVHVVLNTNVGLLGSAAAAGAL